MTKETKLGIFVFAGIFCFILTIMVLGDFQLQRRYALNILFNDIAGLPAKAKVKIAGVEVGSVKTITLDGSKAKVTVWINRGIEIHADSRASIVATGIIGSKYLELTTGSSSMPVLQKDETIIGLDPVSFDKLIADAMEQIASLVASFEGKDGRSVGQNISESLDNLRMITATLKRALTDQENKVVQIVDNVNNFTGDLAEMTADNKEDLRAAVKDIRAVSAKMDAILAKINSGEGTLGKLVCDKEMGEDVKAAIGELKSTAKEATKMLGRVDTIKTAWNIQTRYDTAETRLRFDAGLYIRPRPGKYYYIGGSNLGERPNTATDTQKNNTFDFLFGKEWTAISGYVGVIRSKAGIGASVRPLYKWDPWRRLEVTAEAYDMGRDVPTTKGIINAGARVGLTDWAYIGVQQEDMSYYNHTNIYGRIVLRDDDIAYILGMVGMAARP